MASNQTSNYGLNQWEATDQVLRTEFNEDNQKIDAALKELADKDTALEGTLASQAEQITKLGNCRIETFTYTGTGTYGQYNPTRYNFSTQPLFLMVIGLNIRMVAFKGQTLVPILSRPVNNAAQPILNNIPCTWSSTRVSIYSTENDRFQLNEEGHEYWGLALFAMNENT